MSDERSHSDLESRKRLEELGALVDASRADIDRLQTRADAADERADASHARADDAERRADASEARAAESHRRIETVEARLDVDRALIEDLQAEGLLNRTHAANLEQALRTSRTIGAAIGILMANRHISEEVAFAILSDASQNGNRKLRVVAEEVVHTGDTGGLMGA